MAFALRQVIAAAAARDDSRPGIASSGTYLPELEGLRGLAILLVLLFHCGGVACTVAQTAGQPCTRAPLALIGAGHTGVSLFFVLSGFLLSLPFFKQAAGGQDVSARQFYQRRALRILPLYWSVLLAGVVLSPSTESFSRTLPYLFFVNGIWPSGGPASPGHHAEVMWSLATEVQFYALLPLLFHGAVRRSRLPVAVLILVPLVLGYAALVSGVFVRLIGHRSWLVGISIVGRAPVFLCGMVAAWIYLHFGTRLRAWRPLAAGGDLLLIGTLVALELLLREIMRAGFLPWEIAPYVAWHVVEGMLWSVVLLLVVIAPLRLRVLFVNPVMIGLGVLSYSIYLLHWPFLLWASGILHPPLVVATGGSVLPGVYLLAGVCVALAAVTYRFVERPFLMRKARVGEGRPEGAEPLATERAAA